MYDEAGAAKTAKDEAIAAADTALTTAKAELTGLVSTTSAATLADAKAYADDISTALRTDVNSVSTDLDSAKADIVEANSNVKTLSADVGTLSTAAGTLRADVNTISTGLATETSRAITAEEANAASIKTVSGNVDTISVDLDAAESKIDSLNDAVELLSSAMRFRGVLASSDISADETIQQALTRKFSQPIDGDVVVYTTNGTEYVYVGDTWHELGNENNHATKSQLEIETSTRTNADAAISAAVDKKVYVNGVSAESISVQNISRDAYHDLVVAGNAISNVVYVVSSETLNMYNEKIENLLSGSADGDAVNVAQLNAAVAGSKISAATFNG